MSINNRKLVYGVGVNDADYLVQIKEEIGYTEEGKRLRKTVFLCPFYVRWWHMLCRCYSEKYKSKHKTYIGCSTVPEWHYFMTFRAWMEEQDWQDKHLDKDILLPGNKVYGPDTCVFVSQSLNKFTIESNASRGDYPLGVEIDKRTGKYKATCCDFRTGKRQRLGYFDTPEEAHQAWLTFKLDLAKLLASQQTDQRIANALIKRYENYGKV